MTIKKTLASIVLTLPLVLTEVSCDTKNEPTAQTQPQYEVRNISGKVVNIDEDNFPIYVLRSESGGGANFQYEIIRVQDNEGNIKQLLSPTPTSYQVGDNVEFNYEKTPSITFSDLLKQYGTGYTLQECTIKMEGLIKHL